jgi:hypothetical protein
MKQLDRMFQWQGGTLEEFTAKARRIFLIALPFAVLFWAFGWGIAGAGEDGRAWLNIPMVMGGVAFVAWVCGAGLMMLKARDKP